MRTPPYSMEKRMKKPTLGLLTALGVLSAASLMHPALAGPVASWQFDAGSGTTVTDASGQGNDGTTQGDAGWGTGLVGAHDLSLPGRAGSFVDIPRPVIDTSQSFTVMASVKLNRIDGYQTVVSIDGDQISGFFLQLRGDSGDFGFTVPPADGTGGAVAIAASNIGPEANHWYHLAGVYDAAAHTLSLYVNGSLQETVPFTSPWRATGHTVIGRGKFGGSPVDFVGGQIDDVRLYQSAVSAADIRAVAQAEIPASAMETVTPPAPATLHINAAGVAARVSPTLYGLMTEEINYSYDGGLYAELIQNRAFKNNPSAPTHWSVVQDGGGVGAISLDPTQPLNDALTTSLKLDITTGGQRVGVANDGYWGIPIEPNTTYHASFYAKAAPGFAGPLTVDIEGAESAVVTSAAVPKITGDWKQYSVILKTGNVVASAANRFVISAKTPGTVWLDLVSLMPPTYHNRPNGNRIDLMEKLAAMKPRFLRLPGGNYLEGNTIPERFDWKNTIGPVSQRPTHRGPWGYQSSDGMGLLEFLEWCEDLHMETVLAVYAGYSLGGDHVTPGPDLQPYVQDALDEIEYVTGDRTTKWGAVRAANGHPAPFPVHYVEIGNEDWFDRAHTYDARYAQFADAIKAKYPNLQLIATAAIKGHTPDLIDEHYYKSARAFEQDAHRYDAYDRKGPKIFVGEWASQEGKPTPDLNAALGDSAWMTGMERNSDVVLIESYAPLFVNVNPNGRQWGTNLIGYDALNSYGSPSYYAQVMFGTHVGDVVLPTTTDGGPRFFESVTRDTKSGTIYAKLVNAAAAPQAVTFDLQGVTRVSPTATLTLLTSASPKDTNTITEPTKLVPVTSKVTGIGKSFTYTLPPNAVAVLEIGTK
jgi:alpha-L-arabinofuranosidase